MEDIRKGYMDKCWFLMLSYNKLEHRCGLSKSMDNLDDLGQSEEPIFNEPTSWNSYNTPPYFINDLFDSRNIWNLISDDTFLVRSNNGYNYYIYFDIENNVLTIDNISYFNNIFNNNNHYSYYSMYNTHSMYNTQYDWNNHLNGCINTYLCFEISLNSYIYDGINSYITNIICTGISSIKSENYSIETSNSSLNKIEEKSDSDNFDMHVKYKHLWVPCENCYVPNYKKFLKPKMNICEYCGYYLKMSSLDRIELIIDTGTWEPMDEDMIYVEPIESEEEESTPFIHLEGGRSINSMDEYIHLLKGYAYLVKESIQSGKKSCSSWEEYLHSVKEFIHLEEESIHSEEEEEEESYMDHIDFYQRTTGLTEAVQTGIGQLNNVPIAIGVMDFQFIGGSMGSVVGEKITRLIEYATNQFLPVIIVCASGGARMQEGSLSLMQMAKISSVLYNYKSNKNLLYISILTSPTTGGVTASFGMLGDIIIAEPNAYIAFAGKRVIEQTLKKPVPDDGSQEAEYLFEKGLFDLIVPRNLLKSVLKELFQLHGFIPLNKDSKELV